MSRQQQLARWLGRFSALLLAYLCMLLVQHGFPHLVRNLEERGGDLIWRLGAEHQVERRFVIVDIDEKSLAEVGPWPWSRDTMAALSQQLTNLGSPLHIYDIVFPESREGDDVFATTLQRTPSVLAQVFAVDQGAAAQAGVLQGALRQPPCATLPQARGYVANSAVLKGVNAGHITPRIAQDGMIRQLPALVCYQNQAYPALGLAAILAGAKLPAQLSLSAGEDWLSPEQWLTSPDAPEWRLPLDAQGNARLSYLLSPESFISVSAADILHGKVPDDLLRGSWVLIGATAFGIGDAVPTPHGGAVGGVGVHAQWLSALLDQRLPYTPRGASVMQHIAVLAIAMMLLALSTWRGRAAMVVLPMTGLSLGMVCYFAQAHLLLQQQLWLGWVFPAGFAISAGLLLTLVEYARTRFERERLFANLTSYLPAPVANTLALKRPSSTIEAERRDITVLFADIRNFSAFCENRPPEEAATLLHNFFTCATRIVENYGGVVEAFQGDAVMAVWNAPSRCDNHPIHALAAARALLVAVEAELPEVEQYGLEPLALGMGLESGEALVGSFGLATRRAHTALGQTVTIAARLQMLTPELAQPILLGSGLAARLTPNSVVSQGFFLLEGLRHPHCVYAPALAD